MTQFSNGSADNQPSQEPENLALPLGDDTPLMSLQGVADLLTAMEPELASLPQPYPLFANELVTGILERMGVGT